MQIYPAVDIEHGHVARGNPNSGTTDPVAFVRHVAAEGATWIHVVDLDRALARGRDNDEVVRAIAAVPGIRVQMGGRLRTPEMVRAALSLGAARVVASAAMPRPLFASLVADVHPDCVALGLDVEGGRVAGVASPSAADPLESVHLAVDAGVRTVIYRDLQRDGRLGGADLAGARRLTPSGAAVILAGGVRRLEEVAAARDAGLSGVIVGRALLEGRFTLPEALTWAR